MRNKTKSTANNQDVALGIAVGVGVNSSPLDGVFLGRFVFVGLGRGVLVARGDSVGVGVAVIFGNRSVGVGVGDRVGLNRGVDSGVGVLVAFGDLVGFGVGVAREITSISLTVSSAVSIVRATLTSTTSIPT